MVAVAPRLLPLFLLSGLNIGLLYGCLPGLVPVFDLPKVFIALATAEVPPRAALGPSPRWSLAVAYRPSARHLGRAPPPRGERAETKSERESE